MSDVTIVNNALTQIGIPTITTLSDNVDSAKAANVIYAESRDAVLRMLAWGFATKRALNITLAGTVAAGTGNRFTLPSDCLRVLELIGSTSDYKIEGRELVTPDATASIKYIFQETDTTKYDSLFKETLTLYLAYKLAYPLARDLALKQQKYSEFVEILNKAKSVDNNEEAHVEIISKAYLLLGAPAVSNFDDSRLQLAGKMYEKARDEVLAAHPWNFAVKRSDALSATTTPNSEYVYAYTLPADCLRVLEMFTAAASSSDTFWSTASWKVENCLLLTNQATPRIRYIAQITSTSAFNAQFTNALTFYMASILAPIVGQPALAQVNYELYQRALVSARLSDNNEGNPEIIISGAYNVLGHSAATFDSSDKAQVVNRLYESARDEVLRSHTWNFAMKRSAALSETTAPAFGYAKAFTLPADCLRVIELYGSTSPWRVEAGVLVTDDTTAKVRYIAKITAFTSFSSEFINALQYLLASKLAMQVTSQPVLISPNYELYVKTVASARITDSQESLPVNDTINMALSLIGASSIASLDDNQIRVLVKLYIPTLKETLEAHTWNFAITRATLVQTTAPAFGYTYKYTLPSDCLRVVELYDSDSEWKVELGGLLTDDDTAKIVYIAYISDTTKFSPTFNTALMYHLASKFAVPLAKDKGLQGINYKLYEDTIAQARSLDSREGTSDEIVSNEFLDARY